jgi:hypothetical protein
MMRPRFFFLYANPELKKTYKGKALIKLQFLLFHFSELVYLMKPFFRQNKFNVLFFMIRKEGTTESHRFNGGLS